ncbi:MAG TPA: LamG-like jellyroll fold domain-containing protein, partial [Thermoguttaceae bacterium]|nr:LamG-like jellyroll fold domain-containing protein [Thermoguttaceae bacterium]
AIEIIAMGRILLEDTVFYAGGGDASIGTPAGEPGLGASGHAGNLGQPGEQGGLFTDPGGDGGDGVNGADGADGGTAGDGAQGGGGAGGTVKLFGSVVRSDDAFIHALGGLGGYGEGGQGRFIVGANVNNFEFTQVTTHGGGGLMGDIPIPTFEPRVFAGVETFDGTRELNPHLVDGAMTPYIPGLQGGAAGYGLLDIDAATLFNNTLQDEMPEDAVMAVIRIEGGIAGLVDNFPDHDLLLVVNLTNAAVDVPKLGVGSLGFETPLMQGGLANDPIFGDGTPDALTELAAGAIYATLIPESAEAFTASATIDGVVHQGKSLDLADGEVMFVRPPGLVAVFDQTQAPEGIALGGKTFESIGIVSVTEDPTALDGLKLEVFLNQSSDGLAAADAVLLRRIDPVLPNLHVLDLQGNPLDDRAHDIFIPQLEARAGLQNLVAETELPVDGQLDADLNLRLQIVAEDSTRTWLSVELAAEDTELNVSSAELQAQLVAAFDTAIADAGLSGTMELIAEDDRLAIDVTEGGGIVAVHAGGGAQVGFTAGQAVGTDVEFDENTAPILAPIDNQGSTPGTLWFSGSTDGVSIPHGTSLAVNRTLTLETWLRVDAFTNDWMPIIQKGSGSGTDSRSFSLWANENGYLHFTSSSSSGYQSIANTPAGSIEPGKWYHFAGVLDRYSGRMEVYLDGQLVGVANNSVPNTNTAAHSSPLLFAQTLEDSDFYSPFYGQIDEVRLWNVARGQDEIARDMARTLPAGEPGLVGYWKMNELSGYGILDSSGNGNDGMMQGMPYRQRGPIHIGVIDSKTDDLWFEAFSSDPLVGVTIVDRQLYVYPFQEVKGFQGTVRITVTAHDGTGAPWDTGGRSTSTSFDMTFGDNGIYGTAFVDNDGDGVLDPGEGPLDGVGIFLDVDANGQYDSKVDGPITYTDAAGNYALRSLPFQEPVPNGPAILTGSEDVTPDGGATRTIKNEQSESTVLTRSEATFQFSFFYRKEPVFSASITLPPEMTEANESVDELVADLNQLFVIKKLDWIRAEAKDNRVSFRIDGRMIANFDELRFQADTHLLIHESTILKDGTRISVDSTDKLLPGALQFGSPQSFQITEGDVIVSAEKETTPDGGLKLAAEAGTATTQTEASQTVFVELSVYAVGMGGYAQIVLDADAVGDNNDLGDLIEDLKTALYDSELAGTVNVRLTGNRLEFVSAPIGSQVTLNVNGWSTSTSTVTTTFSEGGIVVRPTDPTYREGALGFGYETAIGTDRSHVVAQLPLRTWSPTTGPQTLLMTDVGQIVTGINFGSQDVNDPPSVELTDTVATLPEDTDTSTRIQVAIIDVTDDLIGTNVLTLSGPDAERFEIDAGVLYLRAETPLDFEMQSQLEVTVDVDDATVGWIPDDSASLTLTLTDVNELPTMIVFPAITTLPEDADTTGRIKVADLPITDDALGTNTLSLAGADAEFFEIEAGVLYLKAGTSLDFESKSLFEVTVDLDDVTIGTTPDDTATIAVAVEDVNEPPTFELTLSTMTLSEASATAVRVPLGQIVITDDALGTNLMMLVGPDAALFQIEDGTLYLRAETSLDFETNPQLDATVFLNDPAVGTTPDDIASFSITVEDVNEPPTVTLIDTVATLPEDTDTSTRQRVADIKVADDALGTHTLTLAGADAELFEIKSGSVYLRVGASLDFETHPQLSVTVAVDDSTIGDTPDDTVPLTISLTDVNEPPTLSMIDAISTLPEDLDTSSRVAVAGVATADDAMGTNVLSLAGPDAELFVIEAGVLYLRANAVLDFETNPVLDVTVEVDDADIGATPDDSAMVSITVEDANDRPVAV